VPPYQAFVEAITGYAAQVGAGRLRADLGPAAGPLAQLVPGLREVLPDVPTAEPLQPDEERLRLLDAVARFLAELTAQGPVVLVLDDLQWADASTLVTLRHIARVLVGHRLLLVGAYRSGEVDQPQGVGSEELRRLPWRVGVTNPPLATRNRAGHNRRSWA
jgi:hypothetical protein